MKQKNKYYYIVRDGGTLYGATWVQIYNSRPKEYEVIDRQGDRNERIIMWHQGSCGAKRISEMYAGLFKIMTGQEILRNSYAKVTFNPFEVIYIKTINSSNMKLGYHKTNESNSKNN